MRHLLTSWTVTTATSHTQVVTTLLKHIAASDTTAHIALLREHQQPLPHYEIVLERYKSV